MEALARRTVGPGGPGTGGRLVLVHGFGQTNGCWGPIETDLAADHELVLVDAPGHGGSPPPTGFVEGSLAIGAAGGEQPATYLGYSMGGRFCLQLAVLRPDLVERLVLVGASPGLHDSAERAARVAADEALAARIDDIGIDAFVAEWLALPLFAGLTPATRFEAERRTNDPASLAASLRVAGSGAQPDLWASLPALDLPVLLVTGELDTKFAAIAEAMADLLPAAEHVMIAGAGHTAHLEQPAAFLAALRPWLTRTASPTLGA